VRQLVIKVLLVTLQRRFTKFQVDITRIFNCYPVQQDNKITDVTVNIHHNLWQRQCASSYQRQVLAPSSTLFSAFHIDKLRGIYIEGNDSNTMWVRNWNCSDEGRNTRMAITLTKLLFLLNTHIEKFLVTYKLFPYVKWRRLTWHNIV
jgi:hypothetical protein